ncbi:FtsK/SpoIIIE domain-containing protein [Dactylosporangium sp. CA-233914]|uniref:FtsK/SpoIIIE domain-containing protein n=1 Tax=Dactylosporangium sp. CA-233914 TaxID=3239934 RepID=UPI003D8A17BF
MDLLIDVRVARRDSAATLDRMVRLRADPGGAVPDLITALLGLLDPAERPQQTTWAWLLRTGRRLDPNRPLGDQGLRCGDTVLLAPPEQRPQRPARVEGQRFELLVLAGPDAGIWVPLAPGEFVIGTGPASDLVLTDTTAGRRHLHLGIGSHEVAATDLRSPGGTRLNGEPLTGTATLTGGQLLRLGATLITVEEVPADAPAPKGPPPAVWLPVVPQPPKRRRLTLRRRPADPAAEFAAAMERAEADAAIKHRAVIQARRAESPSVAHLARAADRQEKPARRPDDRDFLTLRIATADQPSRLRFEQAPTTGEFDPTHTDRISALRQRYATDPDVPVEADLRALGALGAAGDAGTRRAVLRSWVVQLATLAGPNDLALVVLATPEEAEHWTWTGWLPHTRTLTAAFAPGARTVAAADDDRRRVLALVEALLRQRRLGRHAIAEQFSPHVVVVLPDPDSVPRESLARLVEDGPRGGISLVTGAETPEDLPAGVVALSGDGIGAAVADRVAHALAANRDAAGGAAPRMAPLGEVLGLGGEPAPSAIVKRWVPSTRDRGLAAPIGFGGTGPLVVDLRRDGPNGIIAGAPGSGRAWLLRSYLTALAATYPANRLTFVLVDNGGATFAECTELPHTVGVFTGDDGYLARRVLVSLGAEVRRREAVLRRHSVKDIVEMERRHPAAAPANLLIVVAEFTAAPAEFVTGLRELARRGRPAGVHLLLSTAYPHGAVDDDLRAEAPLRIALRVEEEQDSLEVLERPDAAHLSPLLPGRAFVRTVTSDPDAVQIAYGGARSPSDRSAGPTIVTEWRFESGLHTPVPPLDPGPDATPRTPEPRTAASTPTVTARYASTTSSTATPANSRTATTAPGTATPANSRTATTAPGTATSANSRTASAASSTATSAGSRAAATAPGDASRAASTAARLGSDISDKSGSSNPTAHREPIPDNGEVTDLQRLVAAISAAHREARVPDQPKAWHAPLAPTYEISEIPDLPESARDAFAAAIGMVDLPNSQAVQVWPLDLDELGHLLVYGPTGAGKSTLLDTVAAAFERRYDGAKLRVYRVDATDVKAAAKLLGTIEKLVAERAALDEHDGARVLVLVDGHDALLNEVLTAVAAGGNGVGVHLVLATEQRSSVPTSLSRLMPGRIVLRTAGRGLVEGSVELQVATAPPKPVAGKLTTPSQRPRQLRLEV